MSTSKMTKDEAIEQMIKQGENMLDIIEQQQKRVHNLEVAVMAHHKLKMEAAGYCVERCETDQLMENFFDASATLGAFAEVEFKTAE